jgi:diguanylate cyclase (GGDEF)-like protein
MKSNNPTIQSTAQFKKQSQFLSRLITFYQGVSPDLDAELKILSKHFDGKFDSTLIDQSMSKLTGLLLQNSDVIKQQNTTTVDMLKNAIETLHDVDDIQQNLKIDTANLLKLLPKKNTSLYASLPFFEQAIMLYQRALENAQALNKTCTSTTHIELSTIENLQYDITIELRELLEQISITDVNQQSFREIQVMLTQGINHQQLLESCLVVIKAFMKNLLKERRHTRKIVTGLHGALTSVNAQVARSIEMAETQHIEKSKNHTSLQKGMVDFENTIKNETDIAVLKQQTNEYLATVSKTMEQGEQLSKTQQLEMMNLLSDMQTELHKLEQDSGAYKKRLVEQKQRNYRDELTNTPNRLAYNERVELEYARWKRYGNGLCLVVLDIDHFKRVNDNYGHAAGDKTLQVIAKNIASCLRSTDFLFRWGGEEFVLLFPQSDIKEIKTLIESISQRIEQIPFKFKEHNITMTVSIGATRFMSGDTIESVFERADQNLFKAKNSGRNKNIIS